MLYVTRSDGCSYGGVVAADAALPAALDELGLARLATRAPDRSHLMAYTSRNSAGASGDFLRELEVHESRSMGSSEKFCLIAAGQGDVYARLGPTYEWDTAAGQAILEGAGGSVTLLDGRPLTYGKSAAAYLNPGFVAWGRTPLLTRPV
jgi:3'(2'), 5'-bisphosphate nucleotidase